MPTNRGLGGGGGGLDGCYQIPGSRLITSRLHPPGTEEEPRLSHQPLLLVLQSAYQEVIEHIMMSSAVLII